MPEFVKTIAKKYNDYVKYLEYRYCWEPHSGKKRKPMGITEERLKLLRSAIRAKTAIHDIAACNTFQHFVTLTISPESKVNRYDYDDCVRYMSKWLNNHLDHYLLVPEKHDDGAYHFHLLADVPKEKLHHHANGVYRIKSYTAGYSHVTKVKDNSKLAKYITKYITKDLLKTVGKGRKTYWASRDLKRPKVEYNIEIPPNASHVYSNEYLDVYHSNDQIS